MQKDDRTNSSSKKSSAKIYFFVLAILALLGTNVYYAVQYKNLGKQVEVLYNEKSQLQAEIDRIEAEFNRISHNDALILSPALIDERDNVRARISTLRLRLNEGEINRDEIYDAREEVFHLRAMVSSYSNEVKSLMRENESLNFEKEALARTVKSTQETVSSLEGANERLTEENDNLSEMNYFLSKQVETASILKISGISINGIRERNNGKQTTENRARRTDKLKINFSIVENELAPMGIHNVYLRVIDPSGNLLSDNSQFFTADDKRMQYTDKRTIRFLNDGKEYTIDWVPKDSFRRGTYMVVLYSNGYTMGRGSVSLK